MTDHQSGKLKQTNKKHKGRTSKRFQKESFGAGKVASRKGAATSNYARDLIRDSRNNRMNKAKQLQKSKRSEVWLQQRIGANDGPPKVVGIVPLSANTNVFSVLQECLREASWSDGQAAAAGSHHLVNALYLKYKARCSYVLAEHTLASALDVVRVADILVLIVDGGSSQEFVIDQNGASTLSALKAMGLGTPLCCVQNLPPKKHKTFVQSKRMVQRVAETFIDPGVKVIEDDGSALPAAVSGAGSMKDEGGGNDKFTPGKSVFSATHAASEMTRAIVACTVKDVSWRSTRSTLLGDSLELLDCLPEAPESNRVRVTGYLRGAPLYMHSLVHVLGVNTCTLESVELGGDPLTAASRRLRSMSQRGEGALKGEEEGGQVYRADPSKQDSLVMESTPDTLMGEQTWPSEEELRQTVAGGVSGEAMAGRDQRHVPTSIPAGMSSYQADWYVDEKGNFEPEYEDLEQEATDSAAEGGKMLAEDDEEGHAMGGSDDEDDEDDNMTLDGSILNLAHLPGGASSGTVQKSKLKLAQEDDEFPDEVDTPEDVSARVRFARYRNLQSFRTSPWHPKENLPAEYSRIYQFENFNLAQRASLNHLRAVKGMQDAQRLESHAASVATSKAGRSRVSSFANAGDDMEQEEEEEEQEEAMGGDVLGHMRGTGGSVGGGSGSVGPAAVIRGAEEFVPTGQYVSIVLSNVSPAILEAYQTQGFVALFSLLPHENKLSVMHFSVERCEGYDEPIKSKEEMVFQVGFRSFSARPIYSEINLNCDKHKMERFFKKGTLSMASVFGPVTFLPCPVLIFKRVESSGRLVLVAKGALSSIDPDRIMLKKVILTGVPIRVRKRSAVVRQLFYDPLDVRWFKPAELVTKWGVRGHIKEPIGTHGLLKAQFGAPIKQNDTIMLILHKRMFPKFCDASNKVVCS